MRNVGKNREMISRLRSLLAELVMQGCMKGWYGELDLRAVVQDGTIREIHHQPTRVYRD